MSGNQGECGGLPTEYHIAVKRIGSGEAVLRSAGEGLRASLDGLLKLRDDGMYKVTIEKACSVHEYKWNHDPNDHGWYSCRHCGGFIRADHMADRYNALLQKEGK